MTARRVQSQPLMQAIAETPAARLTAAEEALGPYFDALQCAPGPERERLLAIIAASAPALSESAQWLRYARRCTDSWLRRALLVDGAGPVPDLYTCRAALMALDIGRQWPGVLFTNDMPQAFLTALREALPIAMPPESPLTMPTQDLRARPPSAVFSPTSMRLYLRRVWVLGGAALLTAGGTFELGRVFAPGGIGAVEAVLMVLFAVNFLWIALAFMSGVAGLQALLRRLPPVGLAAARPGPLTTATAVLMPTYNEDPQRVFAAVEKIYRDLAAQGCLADFDFFVLSDSTDAERWVEEEVVWNETRVRLGAGARLFYRRRYDNHARKAGNIADFCRRWGAHYEQMLVLDADSLMQGDTIVMLVRLMEANPDTAILQTVPRLVGRQTQFARAQQFAGALYGPVLAAGFAYWCGGDSNYWGHNALLRVRPFAAHAGLPALRGRPPFGGHILSHDFVEAAMLRRAGWRSHMLPLLGGSYEESPPSLIDHALRDRRWCQGNLQHMALLGARGLHPLSRFHLLTGIMSYLASPLWFAFIVVGMAAALQAEFLLPVYFFPARTPYPVWQIIDPELSLRLFSGTMLVLLAPKWFGWLAMACRRGVAAGFGGRARAAFSVFAETLFSALVAPVQMLFQSRFVIDVLRGRDSGWTTQTRDDRGLPFSVCWERHRHHMTAGLILGAAAYAVYPALLIWMVPALLGMVIAAPVSYVGARAAAGKWARRLGLFLIPEEVHPTAMLASLGDSDALSASTAPLPMNALTRVVTNVQVASLHLALLTQQRPGNLTESMAYVRCRSATFSRSDELGELFDRRLTVAGLADKPTLIRLQRRIGRLAV